MNYNRAIFVLVSYLTWINVGDVVASDQIWKKISTNGHIYEIHVVADVPVQGKWLNMGQADQIHSIYIKDESGNIITEQSADSLIYLTQTAQKILSSQNLDPNRFIDIQYLILEQRFDYSVYAPLNTQEYWRQLYLYAGWTGPTILLSGLDNYNHRVQIYKQVIMDAILQPDMAPTYLKDNLLLNNYLLDEALKYSNFLTSEPILRKILYGEAFTVLPKVEEFQTTLLNFKKVTRNFRLKKYLGKISNALDGISLVVKIGQDMSKTLLLQACATALAEERLTSLENWAAQTQGLDRAIYDAIDLASTDFSNIVLGEWHNQLGSILLASIGNENVITIINMTNVLGNFLSASAIKVLGTWGIAWSLYSEQLEQIIKAQQMTLSATLQRSIFQSGVFNDYKSRFSNNIVDYHDIRDAANLIFINSYLTHYFYRLYYEFMTDNMFSFLTDLFYGQDVEVFKDRLITEKNWFYNAYNNTAPPYYLAKMWGDGLPWSSNSAPFEYEWLSNLLYLNTLIAEISPIPPTTVNISQNLSFTVNCKDIAGNNIDDANVQFVIKNANGVPILEGNCSSVGSGNYQFSFQVSDSPGSYHLEINIYKDGYERAGITADFNVVSPQINHDVGVTDVTWDGSSDFIPHASKIQIPNTGKIKINSFTLRNYGDFDESNVPVVMQLVDPDNGNVVYESNAKYTNVSQGQSQQVFQSLTISNLPSNFYDKIYDVRITSKLSTDNNSTNNAQVFSVIVGTPGPEPGHLPLASYNWYRYVNTNGQASETTPAGPYNITIRYLSDNQAYFDISRSGWSKTNQVLTKEEAPYAFDSGNLVIWLEVCFYMYNNNARIFIFEIGVKDPSFQQTHPFQSVYSYHGNSWYLDQIDNKYKVIYDFYLPSGSSQNAFSYLRLFNPPINYNDLPNKIYSWSLGGNDVVFDWDGTYGGSMLYTSQTAYSGRVNNAYTVVPKSLNPGDYNMLIVQKNGNQQSGDGIFNEGFAHSVRMRVLPFIDAKISSINLPSNIQVDTDINVDVVVKNNSDVALSNVPLMLSISANSYSHSQQKYISLSKAQSKTISFTWNTNNLSSNDTYTLSASVMADNDLDQTNDAMTKSVQLSPPPQLIVTVSTNKTQYKQGEPITINTQTETSAVVSYEILKDGSLISDGELAEDSQNSGTYQKTINGYSTLGTYEVNVTASKIHLLPGTAIFSFEVVDGTPPVIVQASPTGQSVDTKANIVVAFSEQVNHATAEVSITINPPISVSKSWSGNALIIKPDASLEYGTNYTVAIGTTVQDLAGNHIQEGFQWSFTTFPQRSPKISGVSQDGQHLTLSWQSVEGATSYNIYRSTVAFFNPDKTSGSNRIATNITDQDANTPGVQWTDTENVTGNPAVNYFYAVTSVGATESDPSNYSGEFDFSLITTSTTDFNEIALPLQLSGISTAADLMNTIPNCNSVARWNATIQGYEQYVPGFSFTNFDVQAGYPYYVNVTQDTVFTLLGSISNPVFNLITTSTTDFNEVMLPLDKTGITKASELMADIPSCNSVARWNASIQGYEQYVPGFAFTDFIVKVGYPYYVNVTANATWPSSNNTTSKVNHNLTKPSSVPQATHAPHAVIGEINFIDYSRTDNNLHFRAYLVSNPKEILSENSPGCWIKDYKWMVQCGSFEGGWSKGDVLRVEIESDDKQYKEEVEVPLSYEPVDHAQGVVLNGNKPHSYTLEQNYPNPFNPVTVIGYYIPEETHVRIVIYDILGNEIRVLVNNLQKAGYHRISWNGLNVNDHPSPSGVYIVRMICPSFSTTRKLMLIK